MITQCAIVALYKEGKEGQSATDLAKTFERRKCNHRDAIDAQDCIKEVVGELSCPCPSLLVIVEVALDTDNAHLLAVASFLFFFATLRSWGTGETNKHRYAVAAQSNELRSALRATPGVPLIHIVRAVMVLEPPSKATLERQKQVCLG